ncbi:MAG: hypothetical protein ABI566_03680 [Pseudolysinimonas sp.]
MPAKKPAPSNTARILDHQPCCDEWVKAKAIQMTERRALDRKARA